ncbi:PREDICTED: DELLA protein RGL1-like [Nicotiana attenuata]|uniref:Della protein rgl1 n=1 Tax=Nicotiana attenuata TaxID=49451 RepID=A0A1J6I210_NICAT|nr:PREDICTED: DELLA protein RGL1-like [Nicotiana attenuata]OIS98569.1 della protein rgl1 [Nicotiana attenuata]
MFSKRHYERATELLRLCNLSASPTGNPVQRVVYCFSEALRERIDKEMGTLPPKAGEEKPFDMEEVLLTPKPFIFVCSQSSSFFHVPQFAGIQAILDNLKSATRVHLIDIGIKSGSHWPILMQALPNQLEILKITAVGTSKEMVEEIGRRLSSFVAENMKFPFSFKAVVSEMKDLSNDLFELDASEAAAVYSEYRLGGMLASPNHLEAVLTLIKSINPCVMVVIDTEANTNTPIFVDCFNEALYLYAALFDVLEVCMRRDNQYRMTFEGLFIRKIIRNMITCEGEDRTCRNVRLQVWRDLFEKFGIKETKLSESSLYHANLMADKSAHGFCTLDMDGKGLIVKWKETPIIFASAWKFHNN